MKAIVFDLGITIKDVVEKPVYHDHVLLSPNKVLISGIENSIYTGILWVQPSRILGSSGIGKVEAVGLDVDNQLEGKDVIVLPYSKNYGGIGTEHDGILAEKPSIPEDVIIPLPLEYSDKYILYPYVSIGLQLRKILRGMNVLIIGDGLTGLLSAHILVGYASRIGMYRDDIYKIKIYGVEDIKNLSQQWDAIVITTMRSWARVIISNSPTDSIIVIPKFMNTWPVITPNNAKLVEPTKLNGVFEYIDSEIPDKLFNQLIGISEDLFSSIPSSKPGILVNIKKGLFEKI